jgi:hypothetical protein
MKYGNTQRAASDGRVFPSIKECARYEELRLLERIGVISNLETQVPYLLIPKQVCGRRREAAVSYVADFVYQEKAGKTVVEDTKGFRTRAYIIKRKLMLQVHGIAVQEL